MKALKLGLVILLICLPLSAFAKKEKPPKPPSKLGDLNCIVDQIAKFDGTHWACSSDKVTPSLAWVVLDANSNPVGEFVSFVDAGIVMIKLTVADQEMFAYVRADFSNLDFPFALSGLYSPYSSYNLYFDSDDCSGHWL